jgi:hypothetical protein
VVLSILLVVVEVVLVINHPRLPVVMVVQEVADMVVGAVQHLKID